MAMVVRSKKILNPQQQTSGNIGPGEYFQSFSMIDPKKVEQCYSGFGAGDRSTLEGHATPEDVGPGKYLKNTSLIKNSFSSANILNSNDSINYAFYKLLKSSEKPKDMKEEFQINNSLNNNINNSNKKETKKFNSNLNSNNLNSKLIKINLGIENRVCSIPSKLNFGYTVDENGLITKLGDPYKDIRYNGDKNDSTSPDYYYREQKSKVKSTLDWGKMSKKELETYKDKKISNFGLQNSICGGNTNININNTNKIKENNNNSCNTLEGSNLDTGIMKDNVNHSVNSLKNLNLIQNSNSNYSKINMIDSNNNIISGEYNENSADVMSNNMNNEASNKTMNKEMDTKDLLLINNQKNNSINNQNIYRKAKQKNPNNSTLSTIHKKNSFINDYYDEMNSTEVSNFLKTNKTSIVEEIVNKNLFNLQPGPGYYFEEQPYKFTKTNYSQISSFGSTEKRKMDYGMSKINQLGPGAYYTSESPSPRKVPNFYPLSRKENLLSLSLLKNKANETNNKKALLGPGSYQIKSQFDKTKYNYSGPHDKRFKIIKKDDVTPGPGDYIQLNEWCKQKENLLPEISEENDNVKEVKRMSNNPDNGVPGVGSYSPGILNSIVYNILSKENKYQSKVAPFSTSEHRFLTKSSSTSNILGPGIYNFAKSDFNKSVRSGVFEKNSAPNKYKEEKEEAKRVVGPGSYVNYNYNAWNKKSFNVLFV